MFGHGSRAEGVDVQCPACPHRRALGGPSPHLPGLLGNVLDPQPRHAPPIPRGPPPSAADDVHYRPSLGSPRHSAVLATSRVFPPRREAGQGPVMNPTHSLPWGPAPMYPVRFRPARVVPPSRTGRYWVIIGLLLRRPRARERPPPLCNGGRRPEPQGTAGRPPPPRRPRRPPQPPRAAITPGPGGGGPRAAAAASPGGHPCLVPSHCTRPVPRRCAPALRRARSGVGSFTGCVPWRARRGTGARCRRACRRAPESISFLTKWHEAQPSR